MVDVFKARIELRYWTGGPTAQRLFAEAIDELEQLRAKCDLQSAALLMVGSELSGDPKIDPTNTSDPRWTPTLTAAHARVCELTSLRQAALDVVDVAQFGVFSPMMKATIAELARVLGEER